MRQIFLFIIVFVVFVMPACSTLDEVVATDPKGKDMPYVTGLYQSDCYDMDCSNRLCNFEMTTSNGKAVFALHRWEDNCLHGHLNIKTYRSDSVVTLIMDVEYGNQIASCICYYDVLFTLENMPEEDFILDIYRTRDGKSYNGIKPHCRVRVEVKDSIHKWEHCFPCM